MKQSTKLTGTLALGAAALLLAFQSFSENVTLSNKYELWTSKTYLRGINNQQKPQKRPEQPAKEQLRKNEEAQKPSAAEQLTKLASLGANLVHITLPAKMNNTKERPTGGDRPEGDGPGGEGDRPEGDGPGGEGDRPEGDGPGGEGDRPEGDGPGGEGDRPEGDGPGGEGDRPESDGPGGEGDRPEGDGPGGEGDRPEGDGPGGEGDRPEGEAPQEREDLLKAVEESDLFAVISFSLPQQRPESERPEEETRESEESEGKPERPAFDEEAWIEMWKKAADQLKGKPYIAAYDLNFHLPKPPMEDSEELRADEGEEDEETPAPISVKELYLKLIEAIRSVDTSTPIIIGEEIMTPEDETLDLSDFTDSKLIFTFRGPKKQKEELTKTVTAEEEDSESEEPPTLEEKITSYLASNTMPLTISMFNVKPDEEDPDSALQALLTVFEDNNLNHAFAPHPPKPEETAEASKEVTGDDDNDDDDDTTTEEETPADTAIPEVIQTNWQLNTIKPSSVTFTEIPEDTAVTEASIDDFSEIVNVAPGMVFEITAEELGIEAFTNTPKVYVAEGKKKVKVAVLTKITADESLSSISCEWKAPVRLIDKKANRGLTLSEVSAEDKVIGALTVKLESEEITTEKGVVFNNQEISSVEVSGENYVIKGMYFGSKPPVALVEFTTSDGKTKYKRCKLDKDASLKYMNAKQKANKSCMKIFADDLDDNEVGYSEITVATPTLKEDCTATGNIILVNKTGLAVYDMSE